MKPVVLFFQSTWSKSWRDKLTGVFEYADKVGWHIQVVESNADCIEVRDILQKWKPIGCMVDRGLQLSRPPIRIFRDIPAVYLDQNPAMAGSCTYLTHDSSASVDAAIDELLKTGIPNLAYVAWSRPHFWNQERLTAFQRQMRTRRSKAQSFSVADDIEKRLLELPKPCGLVCANDLTAQKIMSEANRLGIAIPDELAIIGIDNDEFICEHCTPPLTSIAPAFVDAGYRLAEMLHQRILKPDARHVHAFYGPKTIIRRESSRWLPNMDTRTRTALDFIAKNCKNPDLSVADVVKKMDCSRSLADLLFRKSTGRSIMAEIQNARLSYAFRLLRNPRQRIDAIPTLCGYRSIPFFKRLFKRETDLTMREWRKRNVTQRA